MYKYMNNHFGASRIFSKARFKAAEGEVDIQGTDVNDLGSGGGSSTEQDNKKPESDDGLTVEQLAAELAAEKAKSLKLQNEKDAASTEAANYKKQLRAKMTAEEQISDAKREAEEAREKEFNRMRSELATMQATKRYMILKMDEKLAEETAKAEVSGDMETVVANIAKHIKAIEDTAYQKALADRPDPKAGNGEPNGNSSAIAMAAAYASRQNGVNMDILNKY